MDGQRRLENVRPCESRSVAGLCFAGAMGVPVIYVGVEESRAHIKILKVFKKEYNDVYRCILFRRRK